MQRAPSHGSRVRLPKTMFQSLRLNPGSIVMDKPEPPDSLLDREPSPALIDEWTELLAAPRSHSDLTAGLPLVIFRISDDWFALSALIFERVVAPTAVRWIPFRSNQVFRGL